MTEPSTVRASLSKSAVSSSVSDLVAITARTHVWGDPRVSKVVHNAVLIQSRKICVTADEFVLAGDIVICGPVKGILCHDDDQTVLLARKCNKKQARI
jgi:hypothetical protein